jgi:hypothetical protein
MVQKGSERVQKRFRRGSEKVPRGSERVRGSEVQGITRGSQTFAVG